jgi:hypothetical protein
MFDGDRASACRFAFPDAGDPIARIARQEERMRDDRMAAKRPPQKRPVTPRKPQAAGDQRRGDKERKSGPIEGTEWRGSGVCGDRHTD